jgi:hypothetical protein
VTDQRRDIHGDVGPLNPEKEFSDVQSRGAAVAHNNGRHAHAHKVFRFGHFGQIVGMGMNIDEARGHDQSRGLDFLCAFIGHEADRGDPAVLDCDIREERRIACAVDDPAMADDGVVSGGVSCRYREEHQGEQLKQQRRHAPSKRPWNRQGGPPKKNGLPLPLLMRIFQSTQIIHISAPE